MENRSPTCWALVVLLSLQGRSVAHPQGDRSIILFPDTNTTERSLPVFPDQAIAFVGRRRPFAPPVDKFGHPLCASSPEDTFCVEVPNYPDTEIRKAINYSADEFYEIYGSLSVSGRKITPGDPSEEPVCSQQSRLFYPKAAMNENKDWAYVVNDVDYVQAVIAEMCETKDQPCNYLDGMLPSGVSSRCGQKYAYKRLLALHPNHKKTYTDSFRFPSCCVCYVTKPYILSRTRLGKEIREP